MECCPHGIRKAEAGLALLCLPLTLLFGTSCAQMDGEITLSWLCSCKQCLLCKFSLSPPAVLEPCDLCSYHLLFLHILTLIKQFHSGWGRFILGGE